MIRDEPRRAHFPISEFWILMDIASPLDDFVLELRRPSFDLGCEWALRLGDSTRESYREIGRASCRERV